MNERETPETDSDHRPYPLPEHAQRIRFEGCECVVMAPEDYEALYTHARNLERQRDEAIEKLTAESNGRAMFARLYSGAVEAGKTVERQRDELLAALKAEEVWRNEEDHGTADEMRTVAGRLRKAAIANVKGTNK